MSLLSHLACGRCDSAHDAAALQTVCARCGGPLLARYAAGGEGWPSRETVRARRPGQFRVAEMLPTSAGAGTPTLGEGATPLVPMPPLAEALGVRALHVKDEAQNPTGSFKARGMALAVARAAELGVATIALPSAGNAGAAAAAYGALHGLAVHVALPDDTPGGIEAECRAAGARVERVAGTIADAGRWIAARQRAEGWFSVATLREPYRIEGKKVMGYELLDDLGRLPDVVIYPTGGGTGLIGMWKAWDEMEALGWIDARRPRLVSVQTAGCAPIVRAFEEGRRDGAAVWEDPAPTAAFGLRVPGALGDFLMLRALAETRGTAIAVSEEALLAGEHELARHGLWPCPEGGATLAAARALRRRGWLRAGDEVVLFNTGSPLPYRE